MIRLKEESEKAALKLNIQKTKITVYGPITEWGREGGKLKAMINLDRTLKSRVIF